MRERRFGRKISMTMGTILILSWHLGQGEPHSQK
jgi:hypothetical protein